MSEEQNNQVEKHDLDQVWTRVDSMQSAIVTTQNDVAGMAAKLDSVALGLNQLLSRRPEKTNWAAVGALVVSIVVASGILINTRFLPVEASLKKLDTMASEELVASADHRYNAGVRDGKIESLATISTEMFTDLHDRVLDAEACTIATMAKQEVIMAWITAVDHLGSRRHVISAPQALQQAEREMRK